MEDVSREDGGGRCRHTGHPVTDRTAHKIVDLLTSLKAAKRRELAAELAKETLPAPESTTTDPTVTEDLCNAIERRDQ